MFYRLVIFLAVYASGIYVTGAETVDLTPTIDVARSWLSELLATLVSIGLGYALLMLKTKWNLEIDAKHREALQSVLDKGANLAVGTILPDGATVKVEIGNASIADAVRYVQESVPDAIKHFGLTPADIAKKLEPRIIELTAKAKPNVVAPVVTVAA